MDHILQEFQAAEKVEMRRIIAREMAGMTPRVWAKHALTEYLQALLHIRRVLQMADFDVTVDKINAHWVKMRNKYIVLKTMQKIFGENRRWTFQRYLRYLDALVPRVTIEVD